MTETAFERSSEGALLTRLFESVEKTGLEYAVMRNHESLPYSGAGSDLDLLVAASDAARMRGCVLDAIERAGGVAIGTAETVGFFKVHAFGRAPESGAWWGLAVDINEGLAFRGHSLLAEGVPWPTRSHRGIAVLEDGFAAVLGVLKEVLNNLTLPARYRETAARAVDTDWATIRRLLAPMGDKALNRFRGLLRSSATTRSDASIAAECRGIRATFLRHALATRPHQFARVVAQRGLANARRFLVPSGKVVAILGVDGAGKSTIINALKPILDDATHNGTIIRHLRPTLLPPLARLKGARPARTEPVVDPHASTPSGALGSSFRLAYLSLDYLIGYWVTIRPEIAKKPTIVIFDRYAYDMALDPRRFRIALPSRVIRRFTKLAHTPDVILCLHGRPDVLAARKRELPVQEVARQLDVLRDFARDEPRAVLISTEGTIEEARDQALEALRDCCRARGRGRSRVRRNQE